MRPAIMDELGTFETAAQDPGSLGNRSEIEMNWAVKAVEYAEMHLNLISSVLPRLLKLSHLDEELHQHFRQVFPDLRVGIIEEEALKNPAAKERWRQFCECYKGRVEDYNFGTLLRKDPHKDYTDENTLLGLRVQFLAIEVARNREGINDPVHELYGKKS